MPFQLNYTADDGNNYPTSWWVVGPVSFDPVSKVGSVLLYGWATRGAFLAGLPQVPGSPKRYLLTSPSDYDTYFGQAAVLGSQSFIATLESLMTSSKAAGFAGASSFLSGGGGGVAQYSSLGISMAEAGDVSSAVVAITYSGNILSSGGDYTLGISFKVNGSSATLSSSALQGDNKTVRHTLAAARHANDVVTFSYDSTVGDLRDSTGYDMPPVSDQPVKNNIGEHFRFNLADNSALLALL